MTAHLQPGDIVFMAFPMTVNNGIPDNEKSNRDAQAWIEAFRRRGVTVESWVISSATPSPTVFAVFRPATPDTNRTPA